ncbi:putative retrotransposon hot spot protein (RHS,) [Trypanosoma cruzi]|uniref:Putative retrotransposon hot spot protein (RHS,) n=1 Tax=Trypanosoma cruzi TaxID=5693 RepID=A0A2V2UTQ2_TRYCR|nr:putative retrotransposon hot spot protein (RHS,) [Trypanosoma cruzi]
MEVREGEPPQSWTYKKVGRTLEKDDGVEQSGAARLRLMVLTSEKGWPYSWEEDGSTRDCYVNCEVERVWQTVKVDLSKWFSGHGRTDFTPKRRVLIGTPGIGKSMAAGSYLLYSCCTTMWSSSQWLRTLLGVNHFCLTRPPNGINIQGWPQD